MNTIDKLVLDLESDLKKIGQELPKEAYEKIILLSTIDAWCMGIPHTYDHKSKFDSAVIIRAENYALRYAKENSIINSYESKIKELLAEHSREFNNYLKMDFRGVNPVFVQALMTIKSEYVSVIEEKAD